MFVLVRWRSCLQSRRRGVAGTYVVFDMPTISYWWVASAVVASAVAVHDEIPTHPMSGHGPGEATGHGEIRCTRPCPWHRRRSAARAGDASLSEDFQGRSKTYISTWSGSLVSNATRWRPSGEND